MEMTEEARKKLNEAADGLLEVLKEHVDILVLTGNLDGLDELVNVVGMWTSHRLLSSLRAKGFSKEIQDLCDKAGR